MTLDRRTLLLTAAAAGLTAGRTSAATTPAADAALNRYFDGLSEQLLQMWPETATSLGLDKGPHAALKYRLGDRSWAGIEADRALCKAGLRELAKYPDAGLTAQGRLNRDVVAYALALGRDA